MALVSPAGNWINVNYRLCKMFGYTKEEFLNHTFQDFIYPEDLNSDMKQLQQLVRGKIENYSLGKRYFHKDGNLTWSVLNVSLVRDESSNLFISSLKSKRSNKMKLHLGFNNA